MGKANAEGKHGDNVGMTTSITAITTQVFPNFNKYVIKLTHPEETIKAIKCMEQWIFVLSCLPEQSKTWTRHSS